MDYNMVYADTRYQLQETPKFPLPGKNVTDLQEKILIAINELSQATTIQIADWLGYNNYHIGRTLKSLKPQEDQTEESFVIPLRANTRTTQIHGSVPAVYTLGALGRGYLKRKNVCLPGRFKASELSAKPHTLAVNDFLINAVKLTRKTPWLALSQFKHEQILAKYPMYVEVSKRETIGITPDLWLDFHTFPKNRFCFSVEINLTPVTEKVWREKIRGYVYCIDAYQKKFGTDIIIVPVIVATKEHFPKRVTKPKYMDFALRQEQAKERTRRLQDMIIWTLRELYKLDCMYMADMFRFTNIALDNSTPEELFLSPFWLIPGKNTPVPLIYRKEEHG
jgi:Replication-relaxation